MKFLFISIVLVLASGCATHAKIESPVVSEVRHPVYENKSFHTEVYYSQPQPGIFNGSKQLPLVPLDEATLSVASAMVMSRFESMVERQLPPSSVISGQLGSDYMLRVELVCNNKKGPVYADHEFLKSVGKGILTLGLASSEYDIIADFNVKYELIKGGDVLFEKSYDVAEQVDHERGKFESINSVNDYPPVLFEKHLLLTLNDFFVEAAGPLDAQYQAGQAALTE